MLSILVVGAGPAGISMAVEARGAGLAAAEVLVLEKAPAHSFAIRKYYPESKLVTANYKGFEAVCTGTLCLPDSSKHATLSYLDRAIQDHDVRVRYGETVWKIHPLAGRQGFGVASDRGEYETPLLAIAIGILGKPNKPSYPLPRSLGKRLHFEVASAPPRNARVLVVGGGDSASEYCQYLLQQGNEVTLSYRGSRLARMNDINRDSLLALAARAEVRLLLGSDIDGLRERDGRPEVVFARGEAEVFDHVVYALGGSAPQGFLKLIGIQFDGPEPVLGEGYETSVPGIFLLGDLSAGRKGGSINWAFNSANTAMRRICERYLGPRTG